MARTSSLPWALGLTSSPIARRAKFSCLRPCAHEDCEKRKDVDAGYHIVHSFAKSYHLPIVLSQSDPEGCTACSVRVCPQSAYRNGTLGPVYTAVMMKNIFELADRGQTNIAGMLTWAVEFEDRPYFDGFRALATNGVDKPVLNIFRTAGLTRGDRVKTESTGRCPWKQCSPLAYAAILMLTGSRFAHERNISDGLELS